MGSCLKCRSGRVIGWGFQRNGVKRFYCKGCRKTFNARYGTMFHRMKFSERDVVEMVKFYFTGTPASNIAWAKETTESSVRNVLRKSVKNFDRFEQFRINYDDYVPEVVEVDEIHIKLQGGLVFYAWLAYDPKNKFIIDVEFGNRDTETLERLFKRLKCWRKKVKLVLVDRYQGYGDLINKYLGKKSFKPLVGVINKSKWSKATDGFLTYGLYGNGRDTIVKKIEELGIGNTISTALIERVNRDFRDKAQSMKRRTHRKARLLEWIKLSFKGIRFMRNFIEPHHTLSIKSSKNWIIDPITPLMKISKEQLLDLKTILQTPTLN